MTSDVSAQTQPPQRLEASASSKAVLYGVLLVTVVCSSLLVAVAPRHAPIAVMLTVAATVGCGAVALFERRGSFLGLPPILAAIALVFVVAVVAPPRTSNDLWSYSMYGRIATVHSANPYVSVPSDFPTDPFLHRVSPIWRHRASVYGLVMVGYAATGTLLAGDSPLVDRLFFQITAVFAASVVLVIIWKRTRSPAALVWLGLHPVFGAIAINGGHVDLLIGLGILVASMLASKRRTVLAGVVVGLVSLIKLTALLALVGLVIWAWRRSAVRNALAAAAACVTTVAIGYLPILTSAPHVLGGADHTVTPASVWNLLADALLGHNAGRDVLHPLAPNSTLDAIFYLSLLTVAVVALTIGWRSASSQRVGATIGATTASYTVVAEYAFPWYANWALPALSDDRPSGLAWIVWTQAALMLAALKLPVHPTGSLVDDIFRGALTDIAPIGLAIAFITLSLRRATRVRCVV